MFILYLKHKPLIHGQTLTERNVFPLFSGQLDIGHCNALLPIEEERFLTKFRFTSKFCRQYIVTILESQ
jgi:hypothetical protein